MKSKTKSAKPHKARGPRALKRRREVALDKLLRIKKPNNREQQEIETLKKRVGRKD